MPRPRRPVRLRERTLADGEELIVYRIVPTDDVNNPSFVDAFRSRDELGLPPRRNTPEATTPRINEGISTYRTRAGAVSTARVARARNRDLGGYTARVRLTAEQTATLARHTSDAGWSLAG